MKMDQTSLCVSSGTDKKVGFLLVCLFLSLIYCVLVWSNYGFILHPISDRMHALSTGHQAQGRLRGAIAPPPRG